MDLRKEIKFSDLLPKRGKKSSPEQVVTTEEKEDKPKRGISFARKAKAPKEPKEPKESKKPREKKPAAKRERRPVRMKKLVGLKVGASQLAAARPWPSAVGSSVCATTPSSVPASWVRI